MLVLETPTKLRIIGLDDRRQDLERILTFRRSSAVYEYQRFRKNRWAARSMDPDAYRARLEALKAAQKECLLFEDEKGLWTLPGLLSHVAEWARLGGLDRNLVEYPEPGVLPWAHKPDYPMRPYQREAFDRLVEARHAAVEMGTGVGKSFIILHLIKHFGLRTILMAPSASIAGQLYRDLLKAFGKRYVGMLGDGKKEFKKLITVGIAASLTRVAPGTPVWESLSQAKVFIADESHLTPADTFNKVCHGLAADAPYRFFFSGTQMRNDGADLLLQGITGPIVYTYTVRQGVDEGYLAKPIFRMVKIYSHDPYYRDDPGKMIRHHFLYNPEVNRVAAQIANLAVKHLGHQVVILVDEVEQLAKLLPYLEYECRFAHGGLTKENKGKVPPEYHESDPNALVEAFNRGEFPILVGTSCINTGTDIQTVETIINLQSGKSEIKFSQSVGRGTRRPKSKPEKTECYFVDFDVRNLTIEDEYNDMIHRHAMGRAAVYNSIYGPVISDD